MILLERIILVLVSFIIISYFHLNNSSNFKCNSEVFILPQMSSCQQLLTCRDLDHIKSVRLIARGVVKNVWLAEWNYHLIVVSTLTNIVYHEDFQMNLKNLKFFHKNSLVNKLIGTCGKSIFTQYHHHGSALNIHQLFESFRIHFFKDRLQFCINYAMIIKLLHDNSMVMCDSNSLMKTLSQYLITDQFKLILNDLDALPTINKNRKIKCGHRQLFGDLLAPEQQWPFPNLTFNDSLMPFYDEKIDIWKMADVCEWFLQDIPIIPIARQMLNFVHQKCKNSDPVLRPSVDYVLSFYKILLKFFSS